jgi:hypothetical protein
MAKSMLIVCSHCLKTSVYGWCEECGMGGEVTDIELSKLEKTWECLECGSKYSVPSDFYEDQILFTPTAFLSPKQKKLEKYDDQWYLPRWLIHLFKSWEATEPDHARIIFTIFFLFLITFVRVRPVLSDYASGSKKRNQSGTDYV